MTRAITVILINVLLTGYVMERRLYYATNKKPLSIMYFRTKLIYSVVNKTDYCALIPI